MIVSIYQDKEILKVIKKHWQYGRTVEAATVTDGVLISLL
jgi:hypothetical protein